MAINLQVAQVLQTWEPTQFKKTKDEEGNDLPPGTVRVRTGETGGGGEEKWAYPADPNRMPIPLYGEQVLILNQPDGQATGRGQDKFLFEFVSNDKVPTLISASAAAAIRIIIRMIFF